MLRKTCLQLAAIPFFIVLAVGSSSPKKNGAADDDKAGTTSTTAGSVGKAVVVGDAEWTILDIVNRGSQMKANESYEKDATSAGTFVQVHFKVANKEGQEGGHHRRAPEARRREQPRVRRHRQRVVVPSQGHDRRVPRQDQPDALEGFTEIYELPAAAPPPAPVAAAPAKAAAGGASKPFVAAAAPAGAAKAKAAPAKK